jgi:hypothetical protein
MLISNKNDAVTVALVVFDSRQVKDKSQFGVESFSQAVKNYVKEGKSFTQEPNPVFNTPKPLGSFNGHPFNGTMTPTEVRLIIYEQILGLKKRDLGGITVGFNNGRVVTYKMKQQFNIDSLHRPELMFNFARSSTNMSSQAMKAGVSCKIRGTRK